VASISGRDGLAVDLDLETMSLPNDRKTPGKTLAQRSDAFAEPLTLDIAQHDFRSSRHRERTALQALRVVCTLFLHSLLDTRHAHAEAMRTPILGRLHFDDVGDREQRQFA